ncbi:MAG: hypothetical protein QOC54_3227, partial [Baekduia sp.]|nr:hypothetical protein [Baekduia sp.]
MALAAVVAGALGLLGLGAASVGATTVGVDAAGVLRVGDPEGAADSLRIEWLVCSCPTPTAMRITPVGPAPLVPASDNCHALPDGVLICPRPTSAEIDLGDGDDDLDLRLYGLAGPVTVRDGPGDDFTSTYAEDVTAIDGLGDDNYNVTAQHARVVNGPGADRFAGGPSSDETLDYGGSMEGVSVSFDNVANDGAPGEHDNVGQNGAYGFQHIVGGAGPDSFSSLVAFRVFDGGPGDDTLTGDRYVTLNGGPGNDTLSGDGAQHGGDGDDHLIAGGLSNALDGGPGDDVLTGGPHSDVLSGGPGADRMNGGGGRDTVTYAERSAGVTLAVNGVADDGAVGEGDDIADDVEVLVGGAGDDVLSSGPGPTWMRGGAGFDMVDYSSSPLSVVVTTDSPSDPLRPPSTLTAGDDGALGEGDDVAEIEQVRGSR